jgi:hypothetical protein
VGQFSADVNNWNARLNRAVLCITRLVFVKESGLTEFGEQCCGRPTSERGAQHVWESSRSRTAKPGARVNATPSYVELKFIEHVLTHVSDVETSQIQR